MSWWDSIKGFVGLAPDEGDEDTGSQGSTDIRQSIEQSGGYPPVEFSDQALVHQYYDGQAERDIQNTFGDSIRPVEIPPLPATEGALTEEQKQAIEEQLEQRRTRIAQLDRLQQGIDEKIQVARNENNLGPLIEGDVEQLLIGRDSLLDEITRIDNQISQFQSGAEQAGLRFRASGTINDIGENPLNDYTNVQYHISLTMLGEKYARAIQQTGLSATELTVQTLQQGALGLSDDGNDRRSQTVTIASTGESFRQPEDSIRLGLTGNEQIAFQGDLGTEPIEDYAVTDYNYYSIISLGLENVYAPSQQNPLLSTFTSVKMQIAEPVGFKLHEDIRNIARSLGYAKINPGRIVYRIDIYFSGYDPRTGEWVRKIPLGNEESPDIISYFVALADLQAKVEAKGTTYEADFVPFGHFAYRPEEASFESSAVFSKEIKTFGGFLDTLESQMNTAKDRRTSGVLQRRYQFFCPKFLRGARFDARKYGVEKNYLQADGEGGVLLHIGDDVDLMTLLRGAMANIPLVQVLFLQNDDPAFSNPRIHFGVRFNTIYGNENGAAPVNANLNDYDILTYQFIIEPFLTFKKGTVTPDTIGRYMDRTAQVERIRQIIRLGMLTRIYNYLYTAENTEVIDFDVTLKSFYYTTLNTAYDNAQTSGASGDESGTEVSLSRQEQAALIPSTRSLIDLESRPTDEDAVLERLFGTSDPTGGGDAGGFDAQERMGGGFGELPPSDYYVGGSSDGSPLRNAYANYIDDHLRNDLLTLDGMKIRGDPIWLLSPYGNFPLDTLELPDGGIDTSKPESQVRIYPRTGKLIFLKLLAPDQDDLGDVNRQGGSSYPNIIGGFYEITTIKSMFENGTFTQEIDGVKLNHLNYIEDSFGSPVSAASLSLASGFAESTAQYDPEIERRLQEQREAELPAQVRRKLQRERQRQQNQ